MGAKSKVIKEVSAVYLTRDKTGTFGSTTLTAAAAAGAGTLTVAAITNFAVNDVIRIGDGETMELAVIHGSTAPTGSTITLAANLVFSHLNGSAVREQTAYDIGDPTDDGVTVGYTGETSDINVATKRLPFAVRTGFVDGEMSMSFPQVSMYTIANAVGALLTKVTGAGTAADPRQFITDGNEFGGDSNMALIVVGTTYEGGIIRAELWSADFDYTGIRTQFSRGVDADVPIRAVGSGGLFATSAPTFIPDTSIRPTKASVWDALTEIGFFGDKGGGVSRTVVSGGAAGTNTVKLNGSAPVGAWLRFGAIGSDTIEFHVVESSTIDGGGPNFDIVLRTRFLRSQAVSTEAVEQDLTSFGGVGQDGGTLEFGGSVEPMRLATSRVSIGLRLGNATTRFSFPSIQTDLSTIARALGIPQSDISSGRLGVRNNIVTASIDGVYFRGREMGGNTFYGVLSGCSADVSGFSLLFNNTGAPSSVPLAFKPASAVMLVSTPGTM